MRVLIALLAASVFATACSSTCLQVQQKLCECKGQTQSERNSCEQAASDQEALAPPTDAQLATCEQILPECEAQIAKGCDTLQTLEGKQACGIAAK